VKESPLRVGPGVNLFSARPEDAFVDAQGRLHLRVAEHDGAWWSTELVLLSPHGHGTCLVQTESAQDALDPNVTFGAFRWDPYGDDETVPGWPYRELDLEDSRWTDPDAATNAQMVVQPFDATPLNQRHYLLPDSSTDARLTRLFVWQPASVRFTALRGHHWPTTWSAGDLIDDSLYLHAPAEQRFVPPSGRERLRLNLWLNSLAAGPPAPAAPGDPPSLPEPPADGLPAEVVVTSVAIPEPASGLLYTAALGALALLARLRAWRGGPP